MPRSPLVVVAVAVIAAAAVFLFRDADHNTRWRACVEVTADPVKCEEAVFGARPD